MDIDAVMDEVAGKLEVAPSLNGRTYAWPVSPVQPNSAIVAYPPRGKYDVTYGRGVDTMSGVVVIICGQVKDRQTRAQVAKYLNTSSPECIKTLVDGDGYESCDAVSVTDWEMDTYTIGSVDHLVIVFELAIEGPGTA